MSNFDAMRRLLDERWPDLAALADDPQQFTREMQTLRRLWEREDDARLLAEETEEVLARHPRVRAVVDAVLDGNIESASAAPSSVPHPVEKRAVQPDPAPGRQAAAMALPPLPAHPPTAIVAAERRVMSATEIVIGVLGGLIVLAMVVVLVTALFRTGMSDSAWSRTKDVLLYVNGLAGVVLGYFLGRLPSEVRANGAERAAEEARREAREAKAELERLRAAISR